MLDHVCELAEKYCRTAHSSHDLLALGEEMRTWWDAHQRSVPYTPISPTLRTPATGLGQERSIIALLLAGGTGSRLAPATQYFNKYLLPVYDRPAIYYALATLIRCGIRDVVIVTNPGEQHSFYSLFGQGESLGLRIQYLTQEKPEGVTQPLQLAQHLVASFERVALMFGDTMLSGSGGIRAVRRAVMSSAETSFLSIDVPDPHHFQVVNRNGTGAVIGFEEKPQLSQSFEVTLPPYFYSPGAIRHVSEYFTRRPPEHDLAFLHQRLLESSSVSIANLLPTDQWIDIGRPASLHHGSLLAQQIHNAHAQSLGALEELAFERSYITGDHIEARAKQTSGTRYSLELFRFLESTVKRRCHAP